MSKKQVSLGKAVSELWCNTPWCRAINAQKIQVGYTTNPGAAQQTDPDNPAKTLFEDLLFLFVFENILCTC